MPVDTYFEAILAPTYADITIGEYESAFDLMWHCFLIYDLCFDSG